MAIVKNNLITKGLSGQLGKTVVFRKVGDRTIVATSPSTNADPTEAQQVQRGRFQQAVNFAKSQMGDPAVKKLYEEQAKRKGQPNAHNIAVSDFFHAPVISDLDANAYQGKIGDRISIKATDDFAIQAVTVEITNADGTRAEAGQAVQQADSSIWIYTATVAVDPLAGVKITAKALDRPGNIATQDKAL